VLESSRNVLKDEMLEIGGNTNGNGGIKEMVDDCRGKNPWLSHPVSFKEVNREANSSNSLASGNSCSSLNSYIEVIKLYVGRQSGQVFTSFKFPQPKKNFSSYQEY